MTRQECIAYVESHLEVRHATQNGAYTAKRNLKPNGCVNHSVGCAQPGADVFYNNMNKASAGWGVNAILGDFHKGEGRILLVLPWDKEAKTCRRPWGVGTGTSGGSWNNSRIQWEVCEPAGHSYAGGTMIGYDVAKNKDYFDRMWKMLVAWNVYVALIFGYGPDTINDHYESYYAGMGSGHADMHQWLPKHGKSMDALRAEVKAILDAPEQKAPTATVYPEDEAAKRIWEYCKSKGMTDCGVAGLMGNLFAESGLRPNNLQNTYEKSLGMNDNAYVSAVDNGTYTNFVQDKAGFGLAQWTFWTRKQGLLTFAKARGVSIADLYMQLDYLYKELSESYPAILAILKTATSVRAASDAVLLNFEQPANHGASVQQKRADYGQMYYNKFAKEDDEDMDVTRFKQLWNEMRRELQDNDAAQWSEEARTWAVENGLVAGASSKEFNGMWEDVLTREQAVTLFYRFAKLMGKA